MNSGAPWPAAEQSEGWVIGIQRKLHKWATDDQARRFANLHNLVCDPATVLMAWQRVRGNKGSRSAGVDGQTAYHVEQVLGVGRFLAGMRSSFARGPTGRWRSASGRSQNAVESAADWRFRRSRIVSCRPP